MATQYKLLLFLILAIYSKCVEHYYIKVLNAPFLAFDLDGFIKCLTTRCNIECAII